MKAVLCLTALTLGVVSLPADTLQLRDGRVINGTFEGGDRGGIRFRQYNDDRSRVFDLGQVSNLTFDNNGRYNSSYNNGGTWNSRTYNSRTDSSSSAGYGSADRMRNPAYRDQYGDQTGNMPPATPMPPAGAMPPATPMPQATPMPPATNNGGYNNGYNNGYGNGNGSEYSSANIQSDGNYIPAGTVISVRTTDPIDSDATQIGNTYQVTLAQPIVVNGNMVAPAGSNATVQVIGVQGGNRLTGRGDIALQLVSFNGTDGRTYNVTSSDAMVRGDARGRQSAEVIGGGAALGAIIGGVAGGGPGAAIGAATGAAVGGGVQLMRGHRIRIQPETVLSFNLQQPVSL